MKKQFTLVVAAVAMALGLNAQRNCYSNQYLQQQISRDPQRQLNLDIQERFTEQFARSRAANQRVVYTIPVVVHVLYNTTAQNISLAQINSQLTVLNNDFRKLNADAANVPAPFAPLAADCEINFCLAQRDPNGNATTGIIRKSTTKTSFDASLDDAKNATTGSAAWPTASYLNLWVVPSIKDGNVTGILGYAQFPGGPAATDGVVIGHNYFGTGGTTSAPYNLGRTATHEVGHWLNLRHIWGDANCGNDLVSDTPTQQTSNGGCPAFPKVTCSNGPNGDMFMNYMDYTNDACMYMFTAGQKTRMVSVLAPGGARATLASSLGCVPPTTTGCGTPGSLTTTAITTTGATLNWAAVSGAVSYNVQYKTAAATTWTTITGVTTLSRALTGLTAGTAYNFQVQAVCSTATGSYSAAASFTTTTVVTACTDNYESNNTNATAKTIAVNTDIRAIISSATDKDYFKFANTTTSRNIRVTLTNLAADYDLVLYRGTTQVGSSAAGGTTSETITLNNATVSTSYVAYVFGYGGVFNASSCYTLRASISGTAFRTDGSVNEDEQTIDIPVVFVSDLKAFPNPASDLLTLQFQSAKADEMAQVALFDQTGKMVHATQVATGEGDNFVKIGLGEFNNGLYFARIVVGDAILTEKIMVIK